MDIAGTAWAEDAKPYQPKGATGVAVRTLAELALEAELVGELAVGRRAPATCSRTTARPTGNAIPRLAVRRNHRPDCPTAARHP